MESDGGTKRDSNFPAIIMGNVQSLENKLDELTACVKFQHEYRTCSIMCYTETWLSDDVPDSHVNMEGFPLFRSDRTKDSGKKNGGGVCLFVSEKWCHRINMSVKHKVCTPNVELLTVSVRPYYIPQMSKTPIPLCLSLHSDDLTITLFSLSPNLGLWCRGNRLLLAL